METEKKVLASKLEVTYATDPTPTISDGMLVSNINLVPLAGAVTKRQRAHATFGADKHVLTGEYQTLTFDMELSGSGAAGTAPLYGLQLRGCGMLETVIEDTSVEYTPVSTGQESLTHWFNWSGVLHKMIGARGTVSFKLSAAGLPMMSYAFSGLCGPAATDAAFLDVSDALASFVDNIEVNKANTTFSVHAFSAALESIQIDLGNKVTFHDRPNAAIIRLTDREITGNMVIEATAIASKNWFATAKSGTTGVLAMQHGTTTGNIVKLDAPVLQFEQPSYSDLDGTLGLTSSFGLKRTVGDDEFKLTVM